MKSRWISIRRLKEHEFHCTLRYIRGSGKSWSEVYLRLGEIQSDAISRLLKTGTALLVSYFILSSLSSNGLVSIQIQSYRASIPAAYVVAASSFTFLVFTQHLITVWTLIFLRVREGSRVSISRFSPAAYGLYHGQDEMALATPVVSSNFFRHRLALDNIPATLQILSLLLLMMPILGFILFLVSWQYELAFINPRNFIEGLASFYSLIITACTVLSFLLTFLPLPVMKNTFGIRWGVLVSNYKDGGHPRLREWLEAELGGS